MAKKMKVRTLAEMKDKYIGKVGSKERDDYEYELRMDVLGKRHCPIKCVSVASKQLRKGIYILHRSPKMLIN